MRSIRLCGALSALITILAPAALPDDLATIKQALNGKFTLTTITADRSDIVNAGVVLVLKKSNLMTLDAVKPLLLPNTYKNGRITQAKLIGIGMKNGEGVRTFVSGEKVWLTDIEVKDKEVSFILYSDPINNAHYSSKLNFPLEKDGTPSVSGVMAAVSEVFDIQQDTNGGQQQTQQQGQGQSYKQAAVQPAAPIEAPPPPIAPPPPPPPADPEKIKLGQTPAQVVASFGEPASVQKLGTRQIYVYKDMKVVFVGGKVSDVQ